MDRTSEIEGHQLYESSVIQLPKLVTLNVTNFGTITLESDRSRSEAAEALGNTKGSGSVRKGCGSTSAPSTTRTWRRSHRPCMSASKANFPGSPFTTTGRETAVRTWPSKTRSASSSIRTRCERWTFAAECLNVRLWLRLLKNYFGFWNRDFSETNENQTPIKSIA